MVCGLSLETVHNIVAQPWGYSSEDSSLAVAADLQGLVFTLGLPVLTACASLSHLPMPVPIPCALLQSWQSSRGHAHSPHPGDEPDADDLGREGPRGLARTPGTSRSLPLSWGLSLQVLKSCR